MNLSNKISTLFTLKPTSSSKPTFATIPSTTTVTTSLDNKTQDETYTHYGTRICGKVTASLPALNPFLLKVYNGEKQRQISDQNLQEQRKGQLNNDLIQKNGEIAQERTRLDAINNKIDNINDEIESLNGSLVDAKSRNGEINKMARIKLRIGCVILFILTLYLFVFYSSTFYSAFFKNFLEKFEQGDVTTVGEAMFDPQAIPNALSNGFGELLFILCAPIIFMGLGYCLHFFMQAKSATRFLKAGSVLLITLIFDCILAYLIGKKLYDIEVMMSLVDMPPFSLDLALHDINFWAVIFCGFIVYLIWGIVFDMAMTAYEDLRSNKQEVEHLKTKILELKEAKIAEKQKADFSHLAISKLEADKASIEQSLSQSVHFDLHIIRLALSDFFTGWMAMMNGLNMSKKEQEQANQIYEVTVNNLFK